jgi:hypothetical protein
MVEMLALEMLAQHVRIRGLVIKLSDEYAASNLRPETLGETGESRWRSLSDSRSGRSSP